MALLRRPSAALVSGVPRAFLGVCAKLVKRAVGRYNLIGAYIHFSYNTSWSDDRRKLVGPLLAGTDWRGYSPRQSVPARRWRAGLNGQFAVPEAEAGGGNICLQNMCRGRALGRARAASVNDPEQVCFCFFDEAGNGCSRVQCRRKAPPKLIRTEIISTRTVISATTLKGPS